eukprot:9111052-Alexandrium_andersonii.AAC.1
MERKETESATMLLEASFEDAVAQVEGDAARFAVYDAEKKPQEHAVETARADRRRTLREKGHAAERDYLNDFCLMMPHLDRSKEKGGCLLYTSDAADDM